MKFFRIRSFRQKVFVSGITVLIASICAIILIVTSSVQTIVYDLMNTAANGLIEKLQMAEDSEDLIETLKDQKHERFYRISIIDHKNRMLYDSHIRRLLRDTPLPVKTTIHPEVEEAYAKGIGYSEEHSQLLGQKLIYVAKAFDFHGKRYVIRIAFPFNYIQNLRESFEFGFILFSSTALILFTAIAALILNHLTAPITQIINAIRPYQQGKVDTIGTIKLKTGPKDDFTQLANTLNSLSDRIKGQIDTLTTERNEKTAILDSLAEGVLAVDLDLSVSYANHMALSLLGLPKEAVNQQFPQEALPRIYELLIRATSMGILSNDAFDVYVDGKKRFLNVVVAPRQNTDGAIVLVQDRSIHFKILEMRKDFIANASHELKTPITIIRGFAETLHDNPDLSQDVIVEITDKIVRNCERMTKVVRNLLTLADIENLPQSRLMNTDLVQSVKSCRQSALSAHPKAQILVEYNPRENFDITCDPELLEVAVTNLLDNAAKYSKDNPKISLELKRVPGYVQIAVRDNGIGIPQEDLENVFQRFYTVNKMESKRLGGSGLGLSIVKTIVDKHYGNIHVESNPGEGSIFYLQIADNIDLRVK